MMRFYFLATVAMVSAVCADSKSSFSLLDSSEYVSASSFLIERDTVCSRSLSDSSEYVSGIAQESAHQTEGVAQQKSEETISSDKVGKTRETLVSAPPKESWWSYGKRMTLGTVFGPANVAYQYWRSNQYIGVERGSCQSWADLTNVSDWGSLTNVSTIKDKHETVTALLNSNGKSLVSTIGISSNKVSQEYTYEILEIALGTSKELQKSHGVERVYLPLTLELTNTITRQRIDHRVTLETVYNGSELVSVRILDPQTRLSGSYLSNARALCEQAFTGLSKKVSATYEEVGIQLPLTGNCQKMAAYLAVELADGKSVSELSIQGANAFCTTLHNANEKPATTTVNQVVDSVKSGVSSAVKKITGWFGY